MNLKKLEKANKVLQKIKELDAEIIQIDAYAMQAANDENEVDLCLSIKDIKKEKEESEKVEFDEDGSLVQGKMRGLISFSWQQQFMIETATGRKSSDKKTSDYKAKLSVSATLQILGILLYQKQTQRQDLINQLIKMGVAV